MNAKLATTGRLGWRGRLNQFLRRQAARLNPHNPVRRWVARLWSAILSGTGGKVTLEIQGESVILQSAFRSLATDYEHEALRVFLTLVHPGDVVWDIGANIGIYSILAAKRVGPEGRVVSCEPSPPVLATLKTHIELNHLTNQCQLESAAVQDREGIVLSLVIDHPAKGISPTNRIAQAGPSADRAQVEVRGVTLDELLQKHGRPPQLIKMDIEGAEILALAGAGKLMARPGPRPVFLLAVHPQFLPEFDANPGELLFQVQSRGYVTLALDGTEVRSLDYAEYLIVPEEKVDQIRMLIHGPRG